MNEIPFAQNIMRVCVRTASGLEASLVPVNKKTGLSFNMKQGLNSEMCVWFTLIFALVTALLPAVVAPPYCEVICGALHCIVFS